MCFVAIDIKSSVKKKRCRLSAYSVFLYIQHVDDIRIPQK